VHIPIECQGPHVFLIASTPVTPNQLHDICVPCSLYTCFCRVRYIHSCTMFTLLRVLSCLLRPWLCCLLYKWSCHV